MSEPRIPNRVAKIVGSALSTYYEYHDDIDMLFFENGAPGDPPKGMTRAEKVSTWLERASEDPQFDSLSLLGRVLKDFMERDQGLLSGAIKELAKQRMRVGDILQQCGMQYHEGGRIFDSTATAPTHQRVSSSILGTVKEFDVFISHASEDKELIARPLYRVLAEKGYKVWFDEAVLSLGDSLNRKIDEGLSKCKYGVVILSTNFFLKPWPQRELDGLVARETASGKKAILPIWHGIDRAGVTAYSPTLADRVAALSSEGVDAVAAKIVAVLEG